MIELVLLAMLQWQHFETRWTWDASPTATHYWFCVTDDPEDFTVSLAETDALCAPVLEGTEYSYYDGFSGRVFQSDARFFSVVACNQWGCSGFN
jgi:hypothetical protein